MKKLLEFLFGAAPKIFDQDGNVRHQFPKEKWQAWQNRFNSKEYDWHHHVGHERGKQQRPN